MAYPGYHGYGPPRGGYPPGGDPLYGYFQAVAGPDQQIDPHELQRCLTQSGIAGSYQMFSLDTCRCGGTEGCRGHHGKREKQRMGAQPSEVKLLMIAMLDRDYSGKMGFSEFQELWGALNQWRGTFYNFDRDRSGTMEAHELHQAIASFGYSLSPQAVNVIVTRYSQDGRITFDEFIACAIKLRMLSDQFRRRDTAQNGYATFAYDDFIQVTMYA